MNSSADPMLLKFQRNEITEHLVYKNLAKQQKGKNSAILSHISQDELRHYNIWKKYTGIDVKPNKLQILKYTAIAKIAGLTFAVKLMEKGEGSAQDAYSQLASKYPEAKKVIADEHKHENYLISMINEEKLNYIGAMVLGLNDALVEITGTIAGLTFALMNTKVVGLAALITGIAASLSMAASEYLSKKSEGVKNPMKAAAYTLVAYVLTVSVLVAPYFILKNYYYALAWTLADVIVVIALFTYFVSVVKDESFSKRFTEMAVLSLSVALISFLIGLGLKVVLGISI
jgi:VIT1/CCC1 family predicted Fe2+/Mn2+ transporter